MREPPDLQRELVTCTEEFSLVHHKVTQRCWYCGLISRLKADFRSEATVARIRRFWSGFTSKGGPYLASSRHFVLNRPSVLATDPGHVDAHVRLQSSKVKIIPQDERLPGK